jgi:hypothetical protein
MTYSNKLAIECKQNARELLATRRRLLRDSVRIEREIEEIDRKLELARDTTDVVDGVALKDVEGTVERVVGEHHPTARYSRRYDRGFNLELRSSGWGERTYIGTFRTRRAARAAAIAWVVHGTRPKEDA